MKLFAGAIAVAAALAFSQAAHAEATPKFHFAGTVTYSNGFAPLGAPVTGTFTYAIENMSPKKQIANWGVFNWLAFYGMGAPSGITANVASHAVSSSGLSVYVYDNMGSNIEDMLTVGSWGEYTGVPGIVIDGTTYPGGYLVLSLTTNAGKTGAVKDLRLPRAYDVGAFDEAVGVLSYDGALGDSGYLVLFRIDSIRSLDQ